MTPETTPADLPGKFITLEGIDGAGKSSHVEWIADFLRQRGKTVCATREPGGTPLGEKLREWLLSQPISPEGETLLMFAARQEHLNVVIQPALARGDWVVCDRYTDASYAYQGGGRGLAREKLAVLEHWVQSDAQPSLTLLFDVPCEVARQRIALAGRPLDRFEQEQAQFYDRVRHVYLARAERYPKRFRVLDGTGSMEAIRAALAKILTALD
ncbi:MAG: dTMP kinase [Zoogloeaceae bacterium]|jgi:dTMP kinase|nr:dTMP kinase [Zoogloeaceae bacterium]